MATLSLARIEDLLRPFYPEAGEHLLLQLSDYLDLLMKWNGRVNLTAIRKPEEIVERHFGESLFTARHLPGCRTLLDLGSGAGFPGLPIQLTLPLLRITLAESQNKKASFLREAVRTLGLKTEVWSKRVEEMPEERRFDVIALRAVDSPATALELARARVEQDGWIAHLTSTSSGASEFFLLPGSKTAGLHLFRL